MAQPSQPAVPLTHAELGRALASETPSAELVRLGLDRVVATLRGYGLVRPGMPPGWFQCSSRYSGNLLGRSHRFEEGAQRSACGLVRREQVAGPEKPGCEHMWCPRCTERAG